MARPSKALGALSKNLTKAERQEREEQEATLRGRSDQITPSYYLNEQQVERFYELVEELSDSNILSNLDSDNLSGYIFAIDQLEALNDMINRNPDNRFDKNMMASRNMLVKEVQRYTNEFCLSPQSRAKMGNAKIQAKEKEKDPLLQALAGGKR